MTGLRTILPAVLLLLLALPASAEAAGCRRVPQDDPGRLACDAQRARMIITRAAALQAPMPEKPLIEIVDTVSASGAAYVYSLTDQADQSWLEAWSVPEAETAAIPCHMRTEVTKAARQAMHDTLQRIPGLPPYGPREDVTLNPDGSRSIRLALDSHDIIVFINAPSGAAVYSRHARSADAVNELSSQIINIADQASTWSCPSP